MKLSFSTPALVERAVTAGLTVHWSNTGYTVKPSHDGFQISHHGGNIVGLHWPSYTPAEFFAIVSDDASDFLEAFLFADAPEGQDWPDSEEPPASADLQNRTVYDFAPEVYAALEAFISGFRAYLDAQGVTSDDLDTLERNFGNNVYFSLSGHGVSFRDDSSDLGDTVHAHLVAYSGDEYRFEQLDFSNDETGLLDLSFIPEARAEYRAKTFTASVQVTITPGGGHIINRNR